MNRGQYRRLGFILIAFISVVGVLLVVQKIYSPAPPVQVTETPVVAASTIGIAKTPIIGIIPAFPGAEGFGSKTPGGRGGRVIEVTNLNDSGPGSFRAALEASEPRIVVFRTGGTIQITKNLTISNPYITIAGQTAPGGGVAVRGASIIITTHDVIIRNLRARRGPGRALDSLWIRSKSTNIIIDHCSFSWATDENVSITENSSDITFSWSILSEGLNDSTNPEGPHSMGTLLNSAHNISIHHNLYAHNDKRNPKLAGDSQAEVINNVVYNWRTLPTYIGNEGGEGPSFGDIINNIYKPGPDDIGVEPILFHRTTDPASRFYIKGNIGPGRMNDSQDDWALISEASTSFRSDTPVIKPSGIKIDPTSAVFDLVLSKVGAIAPERDSTDQRIVQSVRDGTGKIIDDPSQVGGWPELAPGTPPQDSDHDGMPDQWETAKGLNPNQDDSAQDRDGDGYTNIEEYINGLMAQ